MKVILIDFQLQSLKKTNRKYLNEKVVYFCQGPLGINDIIYVTSSHVECIVLMSKAEDKQD